ncbi:MAG TPA: hypothetical protein VK960_06020 [Acidimicrobiia bacterium]|nr:hypothetical protein [Acidimicrobiia bacterium]
MTTTARDATILRGTKQAVRGRRPKTDDDARRCADDGCDTLLSRYNTRSRCYAHRLVTFPRIRGKVVA